MAATIITPGKGKIASNIAAPHAKRFFHTLWTSRLLQLTTGNVKAMRDADIGSKEVQPVFSDLQPHSIHRFLGDQQPSLVVAVPKTSRHFGNLLECPKASAMAGHTDPQIFHWFKQLGTVPPRAIMSGTAKLLNGEEQQAIWEDAFVKHPLMHQLAQKMWDENATKTEAEKAYIERRTREEDDKRMSRMANADWRSKHKEREKNPNRADDEEKPIYVMKPEAFAVVKIQPDVQLWGSYAGEMKRVWETEVPPMDPLARASQRFVRMLNLSREKLTSSLNINYNMKLSNVFVFDLDCEGMWAMGTQENFAGEMGQARENWTELRIEYGKDQKVLDEPDMEWWVRGLMRLGAPEQGTMNASQEDQNDELDFRHTK